MRQQRINGSVQMSSDLQQGYWKDDTVTDGLHALLIGVSNYPFAAGGQQADPAKENFNIRQLTAPARTVVDIANWLIDNRSSLCYPLKSVRVLASPSTTELINDPSLQQIPVATLSNVSAAAKAWQKQAAESRASSTLFYFSGHGIRRSKDDSALLLEDFLGPESSTDLDRAISVNNIYNGMANFKSLRNLARTQFYFIDACRTEIENLAVFETQETAAIFKIDRGGVDERFAPIFFASAPGYGTFGVPGGQTLFGRDLLRCLAGGGSEKLVLADGKRGWFVTVGKINDAMAKIVNAFNDDIGIPDYRTYTIEKFDGRGFNRPIYAVPDVPKVTCKLNLKPPDASKFVSIRFDLADALSPSVIPTLSSPLICVKEAGIYAIDGVVQDGAMNGYRDSPRELVNVMPPFFDYALNFG
jgi:hypothetical protein